MIIARFAVSAQRQSGQEGSKKGGNFGFCALNRLFKRTYSQWWRWRAQRGGSAPSALVQGPVGLSRAREPRWERTAQGALSVQTRRVRAKRGFGQ